MSDAAVALTIRSYAGESNLGSASANRIGIISESTKPRRLKNCLAASVHRSDDKVIRRKPFSFA